MKLLLFSTLLALGSCQLQDSAFEAKVNRAVESVKNLFSPTRELGSAVEVPHHYEDKFYMAEFLATMGSGSVFTGLDRLGVTLDAINAMEAGIDSRPTEVRFKARSTSKFVKKELISADRVVETVHTLLGSFTRSTVNTFTRYHWDVTLDVSVTSVNPLKPSDVVTLQSGSETITVYRTSDQSAPEVGDADLALPANKLISLLRRVVTSRSTGSLCGPSKKTQCTSLADAVNRRVTIAMNQSATPTHNAEIVAVEDEMAVVAKFTHGVQDYFDRVAKQTAFKMPSAPTFTPAVPLMNSAPCGKDAAEIETAVRPNSDATGCVASVVVGDADGSVLLTRYAAVAVEYEKDVTDATKEYAAVTAGGAPAQSSQLGQRTSGGLFGGAIGEMMTGAYLVNAAVEGADASLNALRDMLYSQVSGAVGQEVTADDVLMYASTVGASAFNDQFRPGGFSYAIRRSDDAVEEAAPATSDANAKAVATIAERAPANPPEGFMSLEWMDAKSVWRPLRTVSQAVARPAAGWKVALSDGVDAVINTTSFVHGFVLPQFGGRGGSIRSVAMNINARPFGGLVLLAGSVSGDAEGATITPEAAVIVRDRDAVHIPLVLDSIPSPKDFKRAIRSISPRMQAFANAFRALQLSKSVLAVAAIPLKPQMESILNLPTGALSKHLALTDSLLRLFLDYGISPSLVAYDATVDASAITASGNATEAEEAAAAIAAVNRSVGKVQAAIDAINNRALRQKEQEREYQHAMGGGPGGAVGGHVVYKAGGVDSMLPEGAANTEAKSESGSDPSADPSAPVAIPHGPIAAATLPTLPKAMDAKFLAEDAANALRPTILSLGDGWTRKRSASFLDKPKTSTLSRSEQTEERRSALQLLDILTEAGAAPMTSASLHFVMGATHNFAKSVIASVVDANRNVLQDVTHSLVLVSEVLTGKTADALLDAAHPDTQGLLDA